MILNGYVDRSSLYKLVSEKLKEFGITEKDYPINSIEIAKKFHPELKLGTLAFPTTNMGGILYIGDTESAMVLNSRRSDKGQNFDCMHELFHYWFHPRRNRICGENKNISQNKSVEWQANEGAAQGTMPCNLFRKKYFEYLGDKEALSNFFMVSEVAVEFRIRNLNLPKVEKVKLLPKPAPIIRPKRTTNREEAYCPQCKNIYPAIRGNYCKICGVDTLVARTGYYGINYPQGISLDKHNKAVCCPKCGNEDITSEEDNCKKCGTDLYQKCTNPACSHKPESNARYCTSCGSVTSFFADKLIPDWESF